VCERDGLQMQVDADICGPVEEALFAASVADLAKGIARRYFRQQLSIVEKLDSSPVTIADREIEHEMRKLIGATYPHDGIFGEEEGGVALDRKRLWVLDPIDGTMSFIAGMPTFGTLVAFVYDSVPTVGVIDMPMLNERWIGVKGKPTTFNGEVCRSRSCLRLDEALISTTSPDLFSGEDWATFQVVSRAARIRRFGGDCFAYGLLASGCIDIVMESGLKPYDYLALAPVIEGAGGVITGWQGEPLDMASDGRVVATANAQLHEQVMARIGQVNRA
jgi:inositol-phosphate phosphatase/L-galactose 1-phosphate phosphatase/histidinol-phosphatase